MAKYWREEQTHLWLQDRGTALVPRYAYLVRVCGFTFQFASLAELQRCLDYYRVKIHPSTRLPLDILGQFGGDRGEAQRFFERLPKYLREEPKRLRVAAVLEKALAAFLVEERKEFPTTAAPEPGSSPVPVMDYDKLVHEMQYWRERLDGRRSLFYLQVKGATFTFQTLTELSRFSEYWAYRVWGRWHQPPAVPAETLARFEALFEAAPASFSTFYNRSRIYHGFLYAVQEFHHRDSGVIDLAHPWG